MVIKIIPAHPSVLPPEVRIAQRFVGIPTSNVIRILDAGFDAASGQAAVVMERAGERLRDAMERQGRFDEHAALGILVQLLNGLCELGEVLHCDLKPENIMDVAGRWKIVDFGSARLAADEAARLPGLTHTEAHTVEYAAREQIFGEAMTRATDVYALGGITYELLSGKRPFHDLERNAMQQAQCSTTPSRLEPEGSELSRLVADMLEKAQEARPTLSDIARRLQAYLS